MRAWYNAPVDSPPAAKPSRYISALSFRRLTPLFDPFLKWFMHEARFRRALIEQARFAAGQRVLDLGCGTGTLTVLIKQAEPRAVVIGLDGDAEILKLAQRKAARARVALDWNLGFAFKLPYRAQAFDRVALSLVLHHLTTENKARALAEIFRALKPGGELHVVDFGAPDRASARVISRWARRLEETADLIDGKLPAMLQRAGFAEPRVTREWMSIVGTLALYAAKKV